MAKKTVNEAAIEKRYKLGDKPKDIGPDFGLTANQVSELARRRGWKQEKAKIHQKIDDLVLSELEEIHSIYGFLIKDVGREIKEARASGLIGLTTQDGEGFTNKYIEKIASAGLASYLEKQKHANKLQLVQLTKEEPEEDEAPGFNVSPDA